MPGGFYHEAPNGAAPHFGGIPVGMFRPPISPSVSSSMCLAQSSGSLVSEAATTAPNTKRKRLAAKSITPLPESGGKATEGREVRYTLAGSMETPTGNAQRRLEQALEDSLYSDVNYRRDLGSKRPPESLDSPSDRISTNQPEKSDGQTQQGRGWGKFTFNTIGSVVGKFLEFCKAGAFHGFYAGGGKGYEMRNDTPLQSDDQTWSKENDVTSLPSDSLAPIPGGYPESDYSPYLHEHEETSEPTPPPTAKRRQIFQSTTSDPLRKNWVMVSDPLDKRSSSPFTSIASPAPYTRPMANRRISQPIPRLRSIPSYSQRQPSCISHAGGSHLSSREPASFATGRSPVKTERPVTPVRQSLATSLSNGNSNANANKPMFTNPFTPPGRPHTPRISSPSPRSATRPHRRAQSAIATSTSTASSAASMRGHKQRHSTAQGLIEENSPRLSKEAKHIVARRMVEEQERDLRIDDLNAQLKEMIRQGREALGASVEVEGGEVEGDEFGDWEDD